VQVRLSGEFGRLLGYVRPYRGRLAAAVVLLALVGLAEGVIALMITPAVDRVLNPGAADSSLPLVKLPFSGPTLYLNAFFPHRIRYVWTVFAISLVVVFIGKAVAEFLGIMLVQYVGQAAVMDLRNQVYGKLIRQPIGFFQHHPTGKVMSAVISDVECVRGALSEWLSDFFRQAFTLVFLSLVLLLINWRMALGSTLMMPLVIWPVRKLGQRIRRSVEKSQSRLGELSQILQETLSGNRVVKAFGMENFEIQKFRATARRLMRENLRWLGAHVITSPLMETIGALMFVFVLMFARDQIRHHLLTTGAFGTFVYALFKVYEPVKRLSSVYQQYQQAMGASTQVFAYLALEEEVAEAAGAQVLPPFSRSVEFDNVYFAYDSAGPLLRVSA